MPLYVPAAFPSTVGLMVTENATTTEGPTVRLEGEIVSQGWAVVVVALASTTTDELEVFRTLKEVACAVAPRGKVAVNEVRFDGLGDRIELPPPPTTP